uniref:Uncharacterized protein n=1 Tax=Arion vulgaris TaxID=1028688 RepID=A0A0B7A0D5_9EUPU
MSGRLWLSGSELDYNPRVPGSNSKAGSLEENLFPWIVSYGKSRANHSESNDTLLNV